MSHLLNTYTRHTSAFLYSSTFLRVPFWLDFDGGAFCARLHSIITNWVNFGNLARIYGVTCMSFRFVPVPRTRVTYGPTAKRIRFYMSKYTNWCAAAASALTFPPIPTNTFIWSLSVSTGRCVAAANAWTTLSGLCTKRKIMWSYEVILHTEIMSQIWSVVEETARSGTQEPNEETHAPLIYAVHKI